MKHVEKFIYPDLNLDEVAMILHTFLKKLDIKYETLFTHMEKTNHDVANKDDPECLVSIETYTLIIIASYDLLTKKDIVNILDKMQSNGFTRRNEK